MSDEQFPNFRTEGTNAENARVFLCCSKCNKDIRELKKTDSIKVNRSYFCKDCDDGTIRMNPPKDTK